MSFIYSEGTVFTLTSTGVNRTYITTKITAAAAAAETASCTAPDAGITPPPPSTLDNDNVN